MIIRYFPRSWIQIKTSKYNIYIDPSYMSTYYSKYPKKVVFSKAEDDSLPEGLEKGDLILISHIHKDHCKEITIDRLSNENTIIMSPKKYKSEVDNRINVVASGDKYQFENTLIEIVDSYNTSKGNSTKKVHKKGQCVGFIINIDNKRLYFAGDTDFIPEMRDMKNIDIAFIPIGGTFTMNINEAIEASILMKPRYIVPIHHLKADPLEFKSKLEDKIDIAVIVLGTGEEYSI